MQFLTYKNGVNQVIANSPNWDIGSLISLNDAGAGNTNSEDIINNISQGFRLFYKLTKGSGTISVVIKIQAKDKFTGTYVDLLASAALTDTGNGFLTVLPGIATVANVSLSAPIGEIFRARVESGTGSSPVFDLEVCGCFVGQ